MEQLLLPKNSSYYWEIKGIRGKKLKNVLIISVLCLRLKKILCEMLISKYNKTGRFCVTTETIY